MSPIQAVLSPTGGLCSAGYFCPQGSGTQLPCPLGTFMPFAGNVGSLLKYNNHTYDCQLCPGGKACDSLAIGSPAASLKLCEGGYFCAIGSSSTRPICAEEFCQNMYGICKPGFYCEAGSSGPVQCRDGYYTNSTGSESCIPCPQVFFLSFSFLNPDLEPTMI